MKFFENIIKGLYFKSNRSSEGCLNSNLEDETDEKHISKKNCCDYSSFTKENVASFLKMMDDTTIQEFLAFDHCYKMADNYLLAMVFAYFVRANLPTSDYTRINFFAALYLAHDMEEDEDDLKIHLVRWGLGKTRKDDLDYFFKHRDNLWRAMNYRAVVSLRSCQQVMEIIDDCELWKRQRSSAHAGALREYGPKEKCHLCPIPQVRLYDTDSLESSEDENDYKWEPPMKKLKIKEE